MIRSVLRPGLNKRCSKSQRIDDVAAGINSDRRSALDALVGPALPFTLLALVSLASLVHWTTPLRQKLVWQAEENRCVLQLHEFHRAFEAYRKQTGGYPSHPMALYPKYIQDLSIFVCPAYGDGKFSRPLLLETQHAGKSINYTYFFPYLTLHSPERTRGVVRARVPLMFCNIHAQERYEAAYRLLPAPDRRAGFIQRYGVPLLLVLRQSGKVDFVDDLASRPTGHRGPDL